MINETMAKNLGWTNEEAIGKRLSMKEMKGSLGFSRISTCSLHKPVDNFILDMVRNPGFAAA